MTNIFFSIKDYWGKIVAKYICKFFLDFSLGREKRNPEEGGGD